MIGYVKGKTSSRSDNEIQYRMRRDMNSISFRFYLGLLILIAVFMTDAPDLTGLMAVLGLSQISHAQSLINFQDYLLREGKYSAVMEATLSREMVRNNTIAVLTFVVAVVGLLVFRFYY